MLRRYAQCVNRAPRWIRYWATFALFTAFAAQFWRNLLGWWGFGLIAALTLGGAITAIVMISPKLRLRRIPKSGIVFIGFAAVSLTWSAYPGYTALGSVLQICSSVVAMALAFTLPWSVLVRSLSHAFVWILSLSLAFELWVSAVVGGPIFPNFTNYTGKVPAAFYWSRDLLPAGGPIDGIVGNRNLIGFVALLALITFVTQLAAGAVRQRWGVVWILLAVTVLALSRSATVTVAIPIVVITAAFALWSRQIGQSRRKLVYLLGSVTATVAAVAVWFGWSNILRILGKSSDLTFRFDIWNDVATLASQRPMVGWGWVGYWVPWVQPFDTLAQYRGVTYLQAHNAWLDIVFQLGMVGLAVFAGFIASTLWRSWFIAIDNPIGPNGERLSFQPTTLLPLLLLTALVVQSFAESRLLIEGNWILLVTLASLTKAHMWAPRIKT